ncbi:secretion protein HlyD [Sphingomonas sp. Leaf25]|nr:secretion protein HlyD [Sphingomonas sp. Leaf25]
MAMPSGLGDLPWAAADHNPGLRLRRHLRAAVLGLGGLALVAIVGLGFVPIGGAVIGSGQVGAESRVKRIAHPIGGTVAQILVTNGDHVSQGQPLVRLDNAVWGTERAMTSLTVSQLLAQRARLDAERLGLPRVRFPSELTGSTDPLAQTAMRNEARLFVIRQNEMTEQRGQLQARIVQSDRQIASMRAQIAALHKEQRLIAPELKGVKDLWDRGLVTIGRLNQLERTAVEMEGQIASLEAQIAQASARITETRQQMLSLAETRRAEAGTQFAAIGNAINEQRMRHVNADEADRRSLIRAPYAGIVDKLTLTATDDVVRPAETIMEIVPDRDRLTVEAAISPTDIDQVRAGQQVHIRFSAFNSRTTPEIAGRVEFVAAERTTQSDTHQSFYEVRIRIDPSEIKRHPEMVLKPGMPAEVFIRTGHRAMITYLTKPLADQMSRAFKDN